MGTNFFYFTSVKVAPETKFVPWFVLAKNEEKVKKNLYSFDQVRNKFTYFWGLKKFQIFFLTIVL